MEHKRFNTANLDKLDQPGRMLEFPIEFVVEKARLTNPKLILDIGAGTAFFSKPLAVRFPDAMIKACDASPVMINWMQMNVVASYPNIEPILTDAAHLNFSPDSADLIIMVNLHHELNNHDEVLSACYKILKEGGSVVISDWRKDYNGNGPSVEIRYEPEKVEWQLQKAGFTNIAVYTDFPNNFMVIGFK